jgi:EAL domain-containing protein (putative c-di-GMP-specific phosphodiesterase class I)/GGDEF domain-containing protein
MSLFKQLWLGVIFLLILVFSVSVLVTTLSARAYLEQQLSMKNADNASALALSLTEQGADKVLLELTLAAQFDTGYYELIELIDPEGGVTVRRTANEVEAGAPGWFVSLFPIRVEPGIASIQAGWQQAGTLTLRSHSHFAYEELWQNTLMLTGIFLLAGLGAGLVGNRLLKRILYPLTDVVDQAEAIGNRRFVTNIAEPDTLEFKQVVRAMNELSVRIKSMLAQEAERLQKWQRDSHVDKITGLYNREPFLGALEAALESNDDNSSGALCIIRITNLDRLNQAYGRKATDSLLHDIGSALNRIIIQHNGWAAARLNGSDFAILAPRELDTSELGQEVQETMFAVLDDHSMRNDILLPGGATVYTHGDAVAELLNRMDGVLIAAERERVSAVTQAFKGDIPVRPAREQVEHWRGILEKAIKTRGFSLAQFPVVDLDDKLIHYEVPVRLQQEGETWSAGQFLPWIHRIQLSGELDKQVFELALETIERSKIPVAINLSVAAIADNSFLNWVGEPMTLRSEAISNLWVEIPEAAAFRYLENFKRLSSDIKAHGGHMGIEHIGHQLANLGSLHDVGLDYLKVDASFVRNVQDNPGNQTLLRTLCTLGHTIGVSVIAEGVNTTEEWGALKELGIDGATGPGISLAG